MLRQLFSVLKSAETIDAAFVEFSQMLEHAHWMFRQANAVLAREADADVVRDPLYERDQAINDLLKEIRGRIVRHLTVNPGVDIAACLTLMSIAKDAERIGDYCKNVFEVGRFYAEPFHAPAYHEPLQSVRVDTDSLFGEVNQAFAASKRTIAKAAIRQADAVARRCDEIIEQLLLDRADIQTHEAVAYSLLARHYKRVAAHLANICTAVLGKVEKLDFRR
jgi:phosphate transport system protein